MKIWEILKEENVGKTYKCNNENYEIYEAFGGLALRKESTICDQLDFDIYNFMTLNFEFIQQPVTFEEVLNSDKKCRVEHEYLKQNWFKLIITDNIMAKTYLEDVCNYKYMYLKNILYALSYKLDSENFNKVIKEAKWYLEP